QDVGEVRDRQVPGEVEPVAQAHFTVVKMADGAEVVGEELRREDGLGVFESGDVARPTEVVQLVILKVSFVGGAVRDQEQHGHGKEQGRSGALGHEGSVKAWFISL